jgi:hypothetical protein
VVIPRREVTVRRFTVEIEDQAFERLVEVARNERRPIREQAGVLIEESLGVRGSKAAVEVHAGHGQRASPDADGT